MFHASKQENKHLNEEEGQIKFKTNFQNTKLFV